jgi:hypothetical protein
MSTDRLNKIEDSQGPRLTNGSGVTGTEVPSFAAGLDRVADVQVNRTVISLRTALFIDKSGRGEYCVPVGRRIGAVISGIARAGVFAYAFDVLAYPLYSGDAAADITAWDAILGTLPVSKGTAIGAPLDAMRLRRQIVEQIVIVTDGQEDSQPRFAEAYDNYRRALAIAPAVIVIRVGQSPDLFESGLRERRVDVRTLRFDGPGSLSRLVSMLSRPSKVDRLVERLELTARRSLQ